MRKIHNKKEVMCFNNNSSFALEARDRFKENKTLNRKRDSDHKKQ